jgi:hypothetical protein
MNRLVSNCIDMLPSPPKARGTVIRVHLLARVQTNASRGAGTVTVALPRIHE